MEFTNSQNGHKELAYSPMSWLWVFLLGPLYWAYRGVWTHFVVHLILALATFGICHFIYPFFTYQILEKHYLHKGWVAEETGANYGNVSSPNQRKYHPSIFLLLPLLGLLISLGYYAYNAPDGDVISKAELEAMMEQAMGERDALENEEQESDESSNSSEEKTFSTIYYEFAGTFTTNLANSRKMLQLGLAVSAQYDDTVIQNVEEYELDLRSIILQTIGNYTEEDIKGEAGRKMLAEAIKEALNTELEEVYGFGGIEKVHFTSFVLQ